MHTARFTGWARGGWLGLGAHQNFPDFRGCAGNGCHLFEEFHHPFPLLPTFHHHDVHPFRL